MRTIISTTRATRVAKAAPCHPHDDKMINIKLKELLKLITSDTKILVVLIMIQLLSLVIIQNMKV